MKTEYFWKNGNQMNHVTLVPTIRTLVKQNKSPGELFITYSTEKHVKNTDYQLVICTHEHTIALTFSIKCIITSSNTCSAVAREGFKTRQTFLPYRFLLFPPWSEGPGVKQDKCLMLATAMNTWQHNTQNTCRPATRETRSISQSCWLFNLLCILHNISFIMHTW